MDHHHRAGPLKQKNKKHKSGKHTTKSMLAKKGGGKIERTIGRTNNASGNLVENSKAMRILKQKQLRNYKREELFLQRRLGAGNSTLGPPKIIALIALNENADVSSLKTNILETSSSIETSEDGDMKLQNCEIGIYAQHKQKLCVINAGNDLLVAMDAAKVADIIVYVVSVQNGTEHIINTAGEEILSAIRAQGAPSTIGYVQHLDLLSTKSATDAKKYCHRFFQTECGDTAKVATQFPQLNRLLMTTVGKVIHWRDSRSYLLGTCVSMSNPNEQGNATVQVIGYVRGKPLSVNQLIHITDVGTFQMSQITQKGTILTKSDPTIQEDLQYEAEYNAFASEQTWPTEEELAQAEENRKNRDTTNPSQIGMSSYQAAWIDDDESISVLGDNTDSAMNDDDEEDEDPIDQSFCATNTKKHGHEEDEDEDIEMDDESEMSAEKLALKRKQEGEHREFPDEVDVPTDSSARVRFARFRGMKSFRTSAWDPKESLPSDYARLFQFEDFGMVQKLAVTKGKTAEMALKQDIKLKRQRGLAQSRKSSFAASASSAMDMDEDQTSITEASLGSSNTEYPTILSISNEFGSQGYIATGILVTLHLTNVPVAPFLKRLQAGPLIMGALLKHENRLSVLNFSVQRPVRKVIDEEDSEQPLNPVKAKELLSFHCGFRRFEGRPVFSDQSLKSDKHLSLRYLPPTGWSVMTVYGPITFQPASTLVFRGNKNEFIGSGPLMNVDPDRIILKRVILTGTPVKVKKRKAVVRYMFHSPEDIRWFKPVELTTKHGMTGHITESLGTHGDFKAIFNKPIKQHDTVCLYLYKRVYPKRVENASTR